MSRWWTLTFHVVSDDPAEVEALYDAMQKLACDCDPDDETKPCRVPVSTYREDAMDDDLCECGDIPREECMCDAIEYEEPDPED